MRVRSFLAMVLISAVTTVVLPASGSTQEAGDSLSAPSEGEVETVHLLFRVNLDEAVRSRLDALGTDIEAALSESGHDVAVTWADASTLLLSFSADFDPAALRPILDDFPVDLRIEGVRVATVSLATEEAERVREAAIDLTVATVRRRLDAVAAVASVGRLGNDGLLVSLVEVTREQVDNLRDLVAPRGLLEFRVIHEDDGEYGDRVWSAMGSGEVSSVELVDGYLQSEELEPLRALAETLSRPGGEPAAAPPPGSRVVFEAVPTVSGASSTAVPRPYRLRLVVDRGALGGDQIADVAVAQDEVSFRPYVSITFDAAGTGALCALTGATVGRELAIVLDGVIVVAPLVQEPICGGGVRLDLGGSGGYEEALREAYNLTMVLRAGALEAPMTLLFEGQGAHPGPAEQVTLDQGSVPPTRPRLLGLFSGSGGDTGEPCLTADDCVSLVCEGQGCGVDRPGICAPAERRCTRDLRPYCDCDGHTFRTSGSCPGRRFAHRGACD